MNPAAAVLKSLPMRSPQDPRWDLLGLCIEGLCSGMGRLFVLRVFDLSTDPRWGLLVLVWSCWCAEGVELLVGNVLVSPLSDMLSLSQSLRPYQALLSPLSLDLQPPCCFSPRGPGSGDGQQGHIH